MTLHGGAAGDTKTIEKTLTTADVNFAEARQEGSQAPPCSHWTLKDGTMRREPHPTHMIKRN